MCTRHSEPGAGAPDIFDRIADFMVASSFIEALTCEACELPAVKDGYCEGHDRLFRYTEREASGQIAAND